MEVIKWISYNEASNYTESFGGFGGFFGNGMRWKDYIVSIHPEKIQYAEAMRMSVLKNKIVFGGDHHQQGIDGVPVFEDNTVALFSFRAWGDIIAAVWSEALDEDFDYMCFYMDNFGLSDKDRIRIQSRTYEYPKSGKYSIKAL